MGFKAAFNIISREKPILAGPWLGELGWELMRWQGILRRLSEQGRKVTMIARSGHASLYEDFVDDFIPASELGFDEFGETDGWRINGAEPRLPLWYRLRHYKYEVMSPITCMRLGLDAFGSEQSFIRFRRQPPITNSNYVVMHARATDKTGSADRNWPLSNWNELIPQLKSAGLEVVSIGHPMQSACPEGTIDLRGRPLDETIGLMSHARAVIGPSSGPMHLASLCGTPHVVWTDRKFWGSSNGTNRQRYEHDWNPLKTPAHVIDSFDWQPPVSEVERCIRTALKDTDHEVS